MNLTTGTGKIAWQPKRLSAEAYSMTPLSITETLPSPDRSLNVLEGVFPYGPVGVCRGGGTCVLSKVPAGWADSPYPRLMRFRLESEHGTGYVYSAIAKEVKRDGRRALVDFISVQDKFALRSMYTGGLLSYPGLVIGERYLGVGQPNGYVQSRSREDLWSDALAPYLNSEWGVGPDMVGTAGRPEEATPLDYPLDYRAGNPVSQGFVVPDYATEWIFDPGEGWDKTTGSRPAPPWTPERTISASADPQTVTVPVTRLPYETFGNAFWGAAAVMDSNDPNTKVIGAGFQTSGYGSSAKTRSGVISFKLAITDATPWTGSQPAAELRVFANTPSGWLIRSIQVLDVSTVRTLNFQLNLTDTDLKEFYQWRVVAEIRNTGGLPGRLEMTFSSPALTEEREEPNTSGIVIPREFMYPFFAGPTSQFNLTAWVAPPVRALNLPGGLTQFLAQSEVHWTSKGAMSALTTAAMPWR